MCILPPVPMWMILPRVDVTDVGVDCTSEMDVFSVLGLSLRYGHAASFPAVWAIHAVTLLFAALNLGWDIHLRGSYRIRGHGLLGCLNLTCGGFPARVWMYGPGADGI